MIGSRANLNTRASPIECGVVATSEEVYDEELEAIKRRKMAEYQQLLEAVRREEERRAYEARKQAILRSILTPEARQRLTNLRLVRPELVEQLEAQLIQLVSMGRVRAPIDDDTLKEILRTVMARSRREIRLRGLRLGG